jgi:hypothetical protein
MECGEMTGELTSPASTFENPLGMIEEGDVAEGGGTEGTEGTDEKDVAAVEDAIPTRSLFHSHPPSP